MEAERWGLTSEASLRGGTEVLACQPRLGVLHHGSCFTDVWESHGSQPFPHGHLVTTRLSQALSREGGGSPLPTLPRPRRDH